MNNPKNELTRNNLNTQIGFGMGTALSLGILIGMLRRNIMIALAIVFMVGGIIVLYNRRRRGQSPIIVVVE